jgi:hypothetical protein
MRRKARKGSRGPGLKLLAASYGESSTVWNSVYF